MDAKLSRYAAVAEHVVVERYEVACPRGKVVISRWEPRFEVRVSFMTRDVADAFAAALREAGAEKTTPNDLLGVSAPEKGDGDGTAGSD